MLEMQAKGYANRATLLEKIRVAVADIGWMAVVQLYEHKKPESERVIPDGTAFFSAAELLNRLLEQFHKDPSLQEWFSEMDERNETDEWPGSLVNLLDSIYRTTHNQTLEKLEQAKRLCLIATSICGALERKLNEEAEAVTNPILELANYNPQF